MGGQLDKRMLHWQLATCCIFQLFIIICYLANKVLLLPSRKEAYVTRLTCPSKLKGMERHRLMIFGTPIYADMVYIHTATKFCKVAKKGEGNFYTPPPLIFFWPHVLLKIIKTECDLIKLSRKFFF